MYYSSESSDEGLGVGAGTSQSFALDLSYLMLDGETLGVHLSNSVREQVEKNASAKTKYANCISSNSSSKPYQEKDCETTSGTRPRISGSVDCERELEELSIKPDGDDDQSEEGLQCDEVTNKLYLQHNMLLTIPFEIVRFSKLKHLDLSNNCLTHINDFILQLPQLQTLYLKNNNLSDDGLPKDLPVMSNLRELNVSSNHFTRFPYQLYEMPNLRYLYLGGNQITEILPEVKNMQSLNVLHIGGNLLENVPDELGELHQLQALVLCENQLRRLPRSIANLTRLRSLLLHKNKLCCLPVGIVKLRGLLELSLRDNPLVTNFVNSCVKELMYSPPSLLELAARVIKLKKLHYTQEDLPKNLIHYLNNGHRCVNPKCKGMYFSSCVEHIKFVDFCGMYRVPLMHYLCSSRCSSKTPAYYRAASSESESEEEEPSARIRKVLLPNLPS